MFVLLLLLRRFLSFLIIVEQNVTTKNFEQMNNRGALVVGIDHYATSPLNGCVNDALRLQTMLETHEGGTPNFQVELLISEDTIPKIKRTTLRRKIEKLFSREGEVALFYFSGHGTENNL